MSVIDLAASFLEAGNVQQARKVLLDSASPSLARDVLLAKCALRLGDVAGAITAWQAVLERDPRHAEAALALGSLYRRQGWLDKAEAHYSKCLKKIDDDRLYCDYAVLLAGTGREERALAELGRALAKRPRSVPALLQRARLHLLGSRAAEALRDLRPLVAADPEHAEARGLLGMAESMLGNHEVAVGLLEEARRRDPGNKDTLTSLSTSLVMCGRLDEARVRLAELKAIDVMAWRNALGLTDGASPSGDEEVDLHPFFLLAAHQEQASCNWRYRQRFGEVFRDLVAGPRPVEVFGLAHCAGILPLSPAEQLRLSCNIAAGVVARLGSPAIAPAVEGLPVPARLRVGYVLSHLGDHVVVHILHGLLAAHDPARLELHVVTVRPSPAGAGMVSRYAAIPGITLHDCSADDDATAAQRLRDLSFDVLVDLAVYNDGARPGILARRPAPVQVSFLGAPFSSGAPWLDYIMTDPVVAPAEPGWCSEAEARLPACYFVFGHDDPTPPAVPPRSSMGLPEDRFLFSALTNPYKIDPADFTTWLRILAAAPDSLLLLKDGKGVADNLRREAARQGVAPERLLFLPWASQRDYLLRQGMPDLFLDTRVYGAHTTMAESLWMGVPALSCRGATFQSRVGASLMTACGLGELVMPDAASYEAAAIALYHDRARLAALKAGLMQARLTAAPFDMPGQARALEAAFRHMRERAAAGLPPAAFDVAELPA